MPKEVYGQNVSILFEEEGMRRAGVASKAAGEASSTSPWEAGHTPLVASAAIHPTKHLGTGSTATMCHQETQYPV